MAHYLCLVDNYRCFNEHRVRESLILDYNKKQWGGWYHTPRGSSSSSSTSWGLWATEIGLWPFWCPKYMTSKAKSCFACALCKLFGYSSSGLIPEDWAKFEQIWVYSWATRHLGTHPSQKKAISLCRATLGLLAGTTHNRQQQPRLQNFSPIFTVCFSVMGVSALAITPHSSSMKTTQNTAATAADNTINQLHNRGCENKAAVSSHPPGSARAPALLPAPPWHLLLLFALPPCQPFVSISSPTAQTAEVSGKAGQEDIYIIKSYQLLCQSPAGTLPSGNERLERPTPGISKQMWIIAAESSHGWWEHVSHAWSEAQICSGSHQCQTGAQRLKTWASFGSPINSFLQERTPLNLKSLTWFAAVTPFKQEYCGC